MKKSRLISFLLALIMLCAFAVGCAEDPANPVVMTAGSFQLDDFDFMLAFIHDEYFNYYLYGAMGYQEYYERILEKATQRACALNYAKKHKIELTDEELAAAEEQMEATMQQLMEEYLAEAEEEVTDEQQKEALVAEMLKKDTGYDLEDYRKYIHESTINSAILGKLRDSLSDEVELTENEINSFIDDAALKLKNTTTFNDFVDRYNQFLSGENVVPYLVHKDCFTVDQLLIKADYNKKAETETIIDELLEDGITEEEFYRLIDDYGQDENMKDDRYLDWGYVVHESIKANYVDGFVYAAENLIERTKPAIGEEVPELTRFETTDGMTVIKFESEEGIHYLIKNRTFSRGIIQYEQGDEMWNIVYDAAFDSALDILYNQKCNEWVEKTKVTYYKDKLEPKYCLDATYFLTGLSDMNSGE